MTTYLFNKNLFYGSLYSLLNEDDMSVDHVRSIGLIILFFFKRIFSKVRKRCASNNEIEKKQIGIYSQEAGVVTVVFHSVALLYYIFIYIYNSILTFVYNYRSVHLRNTNGHEQWGREGGGGGAYKVFCPFVRSKNDTWTRRI